VGNVATCPLIRTRESWALRACAARNRTVIIPQRRTSVRVRNAALPKQNQASSRFEICIFSSMGLTFRSPSADSVSQGSQPPPFITGVNMIPAKRWGPARDPPQEKIMEPAHETLRYSGRSMPRVCTAADEKRTAIDAVLDRTMFQWFPESGT
jgi:hypothetical protein